MRQALAHGRFHWNIPAYESVAAFTEPYRRTRNLRSWQVSYSHTFTPTLVNEARWGLSSDHLPVESVTKGKALAAVVCTNRGCSVTFALFRLTVQNARALRVSSCIRKAKQCFCKCLPPQVRQSAVITLSAIT